jgi:hypothetical protein
MPSHQERVRLNYLAGDTVAGCTHGAYVYDLLLDTLVCKYCRRPKGNCEPRSGYDAALSDARRTYERALAQPAGTPITTDYNHDYTGESPYAQEHAGSDEGVQGQGTAQRVEDREGGHEPEAGDRDRPVGAAADGTREPSLEDKQTGISIRFVKQYDVEKDKTPSRLNEFGVDIDAAWQQAWREETQEADACGREPQYSRAMRRYHRRIRP